MSRRPAKPPAHLRRPTPRRPPGSKRLANEARILKAAEEVFATSGFSGARTAAIAKRAGVPKANLHYYFGTKEALYRRLLENLLEVWLGMGDSIRPEADPAQAFAAYIAAKVEHSRRRPYASKVFANEMLHGAPQLRAYLRHALRRWVAAKARVIEGWVAAGRMAPIDTRHLFFVIWAMTQTYADFDVQVAAVLGRKHLAPRDYQAATALVTRLVLRGAGLQS
ncbi:MAG TPA: TetR/AcrR family transcriptional regulator [Candidatus Angelobacter sp.]|nr:TetR/AcrR family transcriptional regulator [Candidatus Angelobacter sp.]